MYIWHGLTWLHGWHVCHPYYGPTRSGNAYFPTSVHKMDGWKSLDYEKRVFLGHVCKKKLSISRKRLFLEHVYKKIVLGKSMKKSDFGKRVFLEHVCTKRKSNDKTMHIPRDQNKNEHCVKKTSNIMQAKKRGFVMFVWANASRPAIQRFKTPTSGFQISRRFVNYN